VNLALLYVYAKTANHDKAREIYSRIMSQKIHQKIPISKAKGILKS